MKEACKASSFKLFYLHKKSDERVYVAILNAPDLDHLDCWTLSDISVVGLNVCCLCLCFQASGQNKQGLGVVCLSEILG